MFASLDPPPGRRYKPRSTIVRSPRTNERTPGRPSDEPACTDDTSSGSRRSPSTECPSSTRNIHCTECRSCRVGSDSLQDGGGLAKSSTWMKDL